MSKENSGLDVWARKGFIMVDGKLVKSETLVTTGRIEKLPSLIETAIPLVNDITIAMLKMKQFREHGIAFIEVHNNETFLLPDGSYIDVLYKFDISPCPAPRMTQSDQWKTDPYHNDPSKRQRKPVAKYFAFRDKLVFLCKESGYKLTGTLNILFIIPMPKSWTKKKQLEMYNQPHQIRPDRDNYLKAFQDAFDGDDGFVWDGRTIKLWGVPGETGEIIIF